MDGGRGRARGRRGKKGQRGGQTGAKKKQTEEHETVSHTVSEEDLATLAQKLEGVSTTFVGAPAQISVPVDGKSEAATGAVSKEASIKSAQIEKGPNVQDLGKTPAENIARLKESELPRRPGHGTKGRQVKLRSNFYEVRNFPDEIIHYDVTISDGRTEDDFPKDLSLSIIEELVRCNENVFKRRPVYDRKKSLYSINELPFKSKEFTVDVPEGERQRAFKVNLKFAAKINMRALHQAVEGRQRLLTQEPIVVLDIVMNYAASLRLKVLGSRFFTSDGAIGIGMGCEVWRGYHQSARQGWKKVLLNINMASSVFLRGMPVLEYLYEVTQHDVRVNQSALSEKNRIKFTGEVKNVQIYATHMVYQRKYRVNGLTRNGASTQTFRFERDGNEIDITVQHYFEEELNVPLRYPHLPCLHVGKKDRTIYLPMEVCQIVRGQRAFHRLTDQQKADMIKHTAMRPQDRFRKIEETKSTNFRNDEWLKTFKVVVGDNLLDVPGRILQTPGIIYGQGEPMKPSLGAWNMKDRTLYQGATIESWGLLVYGGRFPGNKIDYFKTCLKSAAGKIGIRLGDCRIQRIANERENAANLVTEALIEVPMLQLLVVILPGKTPVYGRFYANLKRICETENGSVEIKNDKVRQMLRKNGLATQCIQVNNAIKCKDMTLAQLCLKINSKMGGANNAIAPNTVTRPPRIFEEPVIFLGAGVSHPGPRDLSSPSIGAVVGSIDKIPSRYAAAVRIMKHRVEIIEDLCSVTKEMLKAFYRHLRVKPKKIIMFRDGVSEGQFQQVLFHEMRAIQKACHELEGGYQPAITFIVAIKRHHGRFNILRREDGDRSGNCLPGTTIDQEVCHPTQFDYYQYGHAGIQGTSRPTKYHVLWDDSNFTADEIQALSFMLCHLYARCTRSVSLPAPAYYADLLATRAVTYLSKDDRADAASMESTGSDELDQAKITNLQEIIKPHPNLVNRMYFV